MDVLRLLMDRNLEILDHCSYCIPFKSKSDRQQTSPMNLEDAKNSDWIWKVIFF